MAIGLPAYTCQIRTTFYFQPTVIQDIIGADGEDLAVVKVEKWDIKDTPRRSTSLPIQPMRLVAELGKIVKSVFNFEPVSTII